MKDVKCKCHSYLIVFSWNKKTEWGHVKNTWNCESEGSNQKKEFKNVGSTWFLEFKCSYKKKVFVLKSGLTVNINQ